MEQIIAILMALITAFTSSFLPMISGLFKGTGETEPEEPEVTIEMTWPVDAESEITTSFNQTGIGTQHDGIDIVLTDTDKTEGYEFLAAADGTVEEVSTREDLGNVVVLAHSDGFYTVYGNAKDITVKEGDNVTAGQVIGHIGKTGNATTAQLHFGVIIQNGDDYDYVNPTKYVENTGGQNKEDDETEDKEEETTATGTFVITTYGYGHGCGMSQEGAIAMAKNGKTYDEIIKAYFPGTTIVADTDTPAKVTRGGKEITLVEFLCKTVAQEIGTASPIEALKAQAICAYTYAKKSNNYSSGQAYNASFNYSGTNVEKAVFAVLNITKETDTPKAQCVKYNDTLASTYYFASSAGKTTSATNVWGGTSADYLKGGVDSPETVRMNTYTYTAEEMKSFIEAYATAQGITITLDDDPANWLKITSHDKAYAEGVGYVAKMTVGDKTISGYQFRTKVMSSKIKSHCMTITYNAPSTK